MASINNEFISGLPHAAFREFILEVQRGKVPGCSIISKFAENPSIALATPADIWDYPTQPLYTFSTGADIDSISSDNAGDVIEMVIQGLNSDFELVTQAKTLTGQTRAALDTPLIRVFRVFNTNGINLLGNVYVYEDTALVGGIPVDTTKVRAYVALAEQQTLMGIYTVPAGKTAYFLGLSASLSRQPVAANCIFTGQARLSGGVFRTQIRFNLSTTGTSLANILSTARTPFPAKTDFVANGEVSANGTGVSVTFDALLIDDDLT